MTQVFFLTQIDRLKKRFGEKQFDHEFIKLASAKVAKVNEYFFQNTVDTWIGNRKTHNAPLITDFQDCWLAYEKNDLSRTVNQCVSAMASTAKFGNLKQILKEQFGGCASVNDAVEWVKLKNNMRSIKDEKEKSGQGPSGEAYRESDTGVAEDARDFIF